MMVQRRNRHVVIPKDVIPLSKRLALLTELESAEEAFQGALGDDERVEALGDEEAVLGESIDVEDPLRDTCLLRRAAGGGESSASHLRWDEDRGPPTSDGRWRRDELLRIN